MKRAKFSNSASSTSGRSGFTGTGRSFNCFSPVRASKTIENDRKERKTNLPFQALGHPLESRETFGPQNDKY